jgi:hypothetical protein
MKKKEQFEQIKNQILSLGTIDDSWDTRYNKSKRDAYLDLMEEIYKLYPNLKFGFEGFILPSPKPSNKYLVKYMNQIFSTYIDKFPEVVYNITLQLVNDALMDEFEENNPLAHEEFINIYHKGWDVPDAKIFYATNTTHLSQVFERIAKYLNISVPKHMPYETHEVYFKRVQK